MCNKNIKEKAQEIFEKISQKTTTFSLYLKEKYKQILAQMIEAKEHAKQICLQYQEKLKTLPSQMPEAKEYVKKIYLQCQEKLKILFAQMREIKIQEVWKNFVIQMKLLPQYIEKLISEAKRNPKQTLVGGVILIFALVLILTSLSGKDEPEDEKIGKLPSSQSALEFKKEVSKKMVKVKPEKVVLTFTALAEKDFTYQIYYTTKHDVWFEEKYKVEYPGKTGEHKYSIVLPEKTIYRIRIDLGSNPGVVNIKDIYLMGSQEADLNDFSRYEISQIEKAKENSDGSFTFYSTQEDPYIAFRKQLLPN